MCVSRSKAGGSKPGLQKCTVLISCSRNRSEAVRWIPTLSTHCLSGLFVGLIFTSVAVIVLSMVWLKLLAWSLLFILPAFLPSLCLDFSNISFFPASLWHTFISQETTRPLLWEEFACHPRVLYKECLYSILEFMQQFGKCVGIQMNVFMITYMVLCKYFRCRTVTDRVYFLLFLTVILNYDCHQPKPQLVIDAGTTLWLCWCCKQKPFAWEEAKSLTGGWQQAHRMQLAVTKASYSPAWSIAWPWSVAGRETAKVGLKSRQATPAHLWGWAMSSPTGTEPGEAPACRYTIPPSALALSIESKKDIKVGTTAPQGHGWGTEVFYS